MLLACLLTVKVAASAQKSKLQVVILDVMQGLLTYDLPKLVLHCIARALECCLPPPPLHYITAVP